MLSYIRSLFFFSWSFIHLCFLAVQQRLESRGSVPAAWPRRFTAFLPFDVAAVFVHQRQRSARSHSAFRHSLNPSARPHCLRFCARRWGNVGSSTASSLHGCRRNQVWCLTCVQTSESDLPTTTEPINNWANIANIGAISAKANIAAISTKANIAAIGAKANTASSVPVKVTLFSVSQKEEIFNDQLLPSACIRLK